MDIDNYRKNNKKIQVICLFKNSIDEFIKTFDLSICQLVLVPKSGELTFYKNHLNALDEALIKDKIMVINTDKVLYLPNLRNRILKYHKRGFRFMDKKSNKLIFNENDDEEDVLLKCAIYINDNMLEDGTFLTN